MLSVSKVQHKAPRLASGASRRLAQIAMRRASHAGRHALVVENEAGTRSLCRRTLENHGFTVDAVGSGVEAMALARQRRPDLVVIALQLDDAHGSQVVGWMQSNPAFKSLPVVLMGAQAEDFSGLLAGGAKAVMSKPVTQAGIEEALDACFQDTTVKRA